MLDPKKISAAIRARKKTLASGEPEVVDTDARPDADPQDVMQGEQTARMDATVGFPGQHDSSSDDENLSMSEAESLDAAPMKPDRMARLMKLLDSME